MKFDRSWLPAIGMILVLFLLRMYFYSLPSLGRQLIGFASGVWMLWIAWQAWQRRRLDELFTNSRNVQYWRGQRIEIKPQRTSVSLPPTRVIAITALYALLGLTICALIIGGFF